MKHRIITLSLAFVALSVAFPVSAQNVNVRANLYGNATTTDRSMKVRGNASGTVEVRRATTTKASSTERRVEMQQNVAKRKASHTARVIAATVERLENIIARVESRIAKLKATGVDTSVSERYVAEAKAHLSLAKANIALFVSVDLTGDRAQTNFERIRSLAQETKEHIRNAHTSLMNAIRNLKGYRADVKLEINAATGTSQ